MGFERQFLCQSLDFFSYLDFVNLCVSIYIYINDILVIDYCFSTVPACLCLQKQNCLDSDL